MNMGKSPETTKSSLDNQRLELVKDLIGEAMDAKGTANIDGATLNWNILNTGKTYYIELRMLNDNLMVGVNKETGEIVKLQGKAIKLGSLISSKFGGKALKKRIDNDKDFDLNDPDFANGFNMLLLSLDESPLDINFTANVQAVADDSARQTAQVMRPVIDDQES